MFSGIALPKKKRPQGKLVWVNYGSVLDVAVDIRHGSDTFGMYHSEILSSENKKANVDTSRLCSWILSFI